MKKKRRKMQRRRALTVLLSSLCAFLVCVTSLASAYTMEINSFMGTASAKIVNPDGTEDEDAEYFKSEYGSIVELLTAKTELCEQLTDEGVVLLKNNGTLPLTGQESVTCLGRGSVDLIYAGASGGGVISNVGTSVNKTLKEGLENAGFEVNSLMWDFYLNSGYTRSNGGAGGNDEYRVGEVPVSEYPQQKNYDSYNDAAFVVITRTSGESNEAPTGAYEDGEVYYRLNQDELDLLQEAKDNFEKVIVIVNSTSPVEIEDLRQDEQIDAILTAGGLGSRGAYSIGHILSGVVNPSGRLVDTWAVDSLSSPAIQNTGDYTYTNAQEILAASENGASEHNTNYIVQAEGIYTGYKYYETRYEDCVLNQGNAVSDTGTFASKENWDYSEEVSYSLGYGLSYTTFEQEIVSSEIVDDVIKMEIKVTNVGNHAGKDVVEMFVQSPYTQYDQENGIEKSAIQMVNYAKTDILQPNESQNVTIKMDLYNICSYDENKAKTWSLDDGTYYL